MTIEIGREHVRAPARGAGAGVRGTAARRGPERAAPAKAFECELGAAAFSSASASRTSSTMSPGPQMKYSSAAAMSGMSPRELADLCRIDAAVEQLASAAARGS